MTYTYTATRSTSTISDSLEPDRGGVLRDSTTGLAALRSGQLQYALLGDPSAMQTAKDEGLNVQGKPAVFLGMACSTGRLARATRSGTCSYARHWSTRLTCRPS